MKVITRLIMRNSFWLKASGAKPIIEWVVVSKWTKVITQSHLLTAINTK